VARPKKVYEVFFVEKGKVYPGTAVREGGQNRFRCTFKGFKHESHYDKKELCFDANEAEVKLVTYWKMLRDTASIGLKEAKAWRIEYLKKNCRA
jgi:hypothetical protein